MTQILSFNHLKKILEKDNIEITEITYRGEVIEFKTSEILTSNIVVKYDIFRVNLLNSLYSDDHPRLFKNIRNILSKYRNAKSSMYKHKQEIDAKIGYYEKMVWRKNGEKFKREMKQLDLAKYELWNKYGEIFNLE